jgi:ATP-dependent DNA helicase RecG
VLTDAGYMREQGEGVPRMFEVMERAALHPPELRFEADVIFTVTLRNAFVYPPDTMRWLAQFEALGLSANQKRALAYAREHGGAFTSRAYQDLAHLDLYTASRDIKGLVRKGLVLLPHKGGRVYQLATTRPTIERDVPAEYRSLEPLLRQQGFVTNTDIRTILGVSLRQASRIAAELVALGWLTQVGERRGRRYVPAR